MRNMFFVFVFISAFASTAFAKVTLPDILSDNMVLQQNTGVRLWGKATPNAAVKVHPSWAKMTTTVRTDSKGNWQANIQTPTATFTPQTLTFSDGELIILKYSDR